MVTDPTRLTAWIEALSFDVRVVTNRSSQELWVTPAHEAGPLVVVRPGDHDTWEIIHEHRVPASVLSSQWQASWDADPPAAGVALAAREVADTFVLVDATTREDGGDLVVQFGVPVFDEDLTRQAFVLSLSSMQKAARGFERVLARRAQELAMWHEFEAGSDQHRKEQEALLDAMAVPVPEPAATAAVPAVAAHPMEGWAATHTIARPAQAWAQPDPNGAVIGVLERRVPVQVVERQGDWARVVCSNTWSAWVDGRNLKGR
jgi:hypothetical protein